MGYRTPPQELRELLSLARKMREMAAQAELETDRHLYASAADVLSDRARWLAETTPEQRAEKARSHQPVNMWV